MNTTTDRHSEIIERVEAVRRDTGLNKSQFSAAFGMKPQTYNNFLGNQRSKPNIHLIAGVVERFNVNPAWLLSGSGPRYSVPTAVPGVPAGQGLPVEGGSGGGGMDTQQVSDALASLCDTLAAVQAELAELNQNLRAIRRDGTQGL